MDGEIFKEGFMAKLLTRCLTSPTFKCGMIKVLLEAGANPDVPGERTPKVLKTNNRTPDASLLFGVVRNNSSRYPLLLATELGHVEAVKILLSGFTALYIAALQFHINLIGGSGGGVPGARPPYGTQFFRFRIHFH